eukprot:549560-Prymnesium_polylepis.1
MAPAGSARIVEALGLGINSGRAKPRRPGAPRVRCCSPTLVPTLNVSSRTGADCRGAKPESGRKNCCLPPTLAFARVLKLRYIKFR